MHPWLPKELADVSPSYELYEKSWRMGEVSNEWRKANVTLISKKGKKEGKGNY